MLLLDYLKLKLGNLNDTLGYSFSGSTTGDFSIVLEDSLTTYDSTYTDESQCTDIMKLRKLGTWKMWQKILSDVADNVDFSSDGASFKQGTFYDHILMMYKLSFLEAMPYLDMYAVGVDVTSGSCCHDEFNFYY